MYLVNLSSGWKLWWSVFFSIMLVVGWAITPAQAHCKKPDHGDCNSGGGGGGKPPKGPANPVIAFTAGGLGEIRVMDADGGNQKSVVSGGGIRQPSWSPDGRFLAYFGFDCRVSLVELINPEMNEWRGPIQLECDQSGATSTPAFGPFTREDGDGNTIYTLAYRGRDLGAVPMNREDIIVIEFTLPDNGPVQIPSWVNITNTNNNLFDEISPSWSPLGDEIVLTAWDTSAVPNDPSTWVKDIVIYKADGSGKVQGLVQGNTAFPGTTIREVDVGNPDWAKTNPDLILFEAKIEGGDRDIYCIERSAGKVVNVTQHIDEREGVEGADTFPTWLPDDTGFLFARNYGQIIEMRFDESLSGCPTRDQLENASEVIPLTKGRKRVDETDYWRNAPTP